MGIQIIDINGKTVTTFLTTSSARLGKRSGDQESVARGMNGELVKDSCLHRNDIITIDISALSKGVYFVKTGDQAQKFVKE